MGDPFISRESRRIVIEMLSESLRGQLLEFKPPWARVSERVTYMIGRITSGCRPPSVDIGTGVRMSLPGNPATNSWYFSGVSAWAEFKLVKGLMVLIL